MHICSAVSGGIKLNKGYKDYGIQVQKSIFEVNINNKVFDNMKIRIKEIIEP